jgi:copper chaperone CopZ
MHEMIAYCGLVCTGCPAYIATQENSDTSRKQVVEKWSSDQYPLKIEDINCDGCLSTGKRLIKFCNQCEVRACGNAKKVENCAHCDDYVCSKLEKLWGIVNSVEARARLDKINKSRSK